MTRLIERLASLLPRMRRDVRGVAAIEFAFLVSILSLVMVNVADVAIYIFERMEVENAADLGAMIVLKNCDTQHVPATTLCSGLNAAVTSAVQSTSLGNQVTLQGGAPTEGYYCVNSSNALQYVSDVNSKPADCIAAGSPLLTPGDYIKVQVTYTYAPLFGHLSVGSAFTTPITKTALMRIG